MPVPHELTLTSAELALYEALLAITVAAKLGAIEELVDVTQTLETYLAKNPDALQEAIVRLHQLTFPSLSDLLEPA